KSQGPTLHNLPNPRQPPPRKNPFRPGFFPAPVLLKQFDTHKKQEITSDEAAAGFARWFDSWNTDKSGFLTQDQLRAGLNQDLSTTTPGPFARPTAQRPPQ